MSELFTTIEEAEAYLLNYSPEKQSGETYTLGRMQALMERLGSPQNHVAAVHVAGTSGKTSTSQYVQSILSAHGKSTGLTTSPHISSIDERVRVNGSPLPDETFIAYLQEFLRIITPWDLKPTYFELLTAFAFWVFDKERVDYMVIEVGLGGLLDATNVMASDKKVSVITPIGLDHTEILGNTHAEIATQKAGIINDDSYVITCSQELEVRHVITAVAGSCNARVQYVDTPNDDASLAPLFQQENFALAKAAVQYIAKRDKFAFKDSAEVAELIANTPPGRFEIFNVGGKTVVLDGAHNPQKLVAFDRSLRSRYGDGPYAWLVGFIEAPETKIRSCVQSIGNKTDLFITTQFSVGQDIKGRRSVDAGRLATIFKIEGNNATTVSDSAMALETLLQSSQRTVVVTGSLYLVAILRNKIIERVNEESAGDSAVHFGPTQT